MGEGGTVGWTGERVWNREENRLSSQLSQAGAQGQTVNGQPFFLYFFIFLNFIFAQFHA